MAKKNVTGQESAAETMTAESAESMDVARNVAFKSARKLLLAYVGGWALAWDGLQDLAERMVERGAVAEKDARKLAQRVSEEHLPAEFERPVQRLMGRMDLPSKSDIQALGAKVASLTEQVDELRKQRA